MFLNIVLHCVYAPSCPHSPALITLGILLGSVPKLRKPFRTPACPSCANCRLGAGRKQIQSQISLAFLRPEWGDDLFSVNHRISEHLCLFEVSALSRAIQPSTRKRRVLLNLFTSSPGWMRCKASPAFCRNTFRLRA